MTAREASVLVHTLEAAACVGDSGGARRAAAQALEMLSALATSWCGRSGDGSCCCDPVSFCAQLEHVVTCDDEAIVAGGTSLRRTLSDSMSECLRHNFSATRQPPLVVLSAVYVSSSVYCQCRAASAVVEHPLTVRDAEAGMLSLFRLRTHARTPARSLLSETVMRSVALLERERDYEEVREGATIHSRLSCVLSVLLPSASYRPYPNLLRSIDRRITARTCVRTYCGKPPTHTSLLTF